MTEPGGILFIGPDVPGTSPVLDRLRETPAPLTILPNVYLGLACWGRGVLKPRAVAVCVDGLPAAEFEFFQIAAREHADTPVFVCGRSSAAQKLEDAVRAGARGILAPEDVGELLHEIGPSNGRALPPLAEAPSARPPATPAPELELIQREHAERQHLNQPPLRIADEPFELEAESPLAARVPWKNYAGRPTRTPPGRKSADPAGGDSGIFDGPLLTPEELSALLRDDPNGHSDPSDPSK